MAENITRLLTQTVDYAAAVEELCDRDARVFIDLSTNQMCGTRASATLKNRHDAVVASLYSANEASEMLLNLCAALLASNVPFEQQLLLSILLKTARRRPLRYRRPSRFFQPTHLRRLFFCIHLNPVS